MRAFVKARPLGVTEQIYSLFLWALFWVARGCVGSHPLSIESVLFFHIISPITILVGES